MGALKRQATYKETMNMDVEARTDLMPCAPAASRKVLRRRTISLRDLFWLILAIALAFGGYRWGFQAGKDYIEPTVVYAKLHQLQFAVDDRMAKDALLDLILQTVRPHTWQVAGGEGKVEYFAQSNSLVVSSSELVHKEVPELLRQLAQLELHDPRSARYQRVSDFLKNARPESVRSSTP